MRRTEAHQRERQWPPHTTSTVPWRSTVRGPRPDRETTSIRVSVPSRIAAVQWSPDGTTAALLDRAGTALRELDAQHGPGLTALSGVLDRTEAVASSRIEEERATLDDVARAVVGIRANPGATAMVRAGGAIDGLVAAAGSGTITEASLLTAHRLLMRENPSTAGTPAGTATCRTGSAADAPHASHGTSHHHRNSSSR